MERPIYHRLEQKVKAHIFLCRAVRSVASSTQTQARTKKRSPMSKVTAIAFYPLLEMAKLSSCQAESRVGEERLKVRLSFCDRFWGFVPKAFIIEERYTQTAIASCSDFRLNELHWHWLISQAC